MRGWSLAAALAWTFDEQRHIDRSHSHDPEYDELSARLALDEARARGSIIDVVHAWELPIVAESPSSSFDPVPFERSSHELVDSMLADADTSGLVQPSARVIVTARSAAGALIARSTDADLL